MAGGGGCAPGVALGDVDAHGARVLGVEAIRPATRHDDDLTAAIARLHERLGVPARAVRRVAVSVGPGGYTSLRMACATAQMIALAGGASCVAVPTAAVAFCTLRAVLPRSPVAIALAGKSEAAWVTAWTGPDAPVHEPSHPGRLMTAADLPALGARVLVADDHVPVQIRDAARSAGVTIVPTALDAGALLVAVSWFPDVEPARCVPLYGREPEAVTKWRALHGARGA